MSGRDLSLRIQINSQANGAGISQTQQGLSSLTQQVEGIKARLSGLLGLSVGAILFGIAADLLKTADSYKVMEARLKLVSDNTKEFATAQKELFDVAQRSRVSLDATVNVYGKLETAIKSMGGTQQQAIKTTETLTQAIALTSTGAAQDEAAILQFNQALASGVLRGDEFNSVMENSPGLAQALAEGLGVTTGRLRAMAEAGELTSDKLINALGKSADSVAKKFSLLPMTISQATTQISTAFTKYIGEGDKASGVTTQLASAISGVAGNFNTIANSVLIVAEIYGTKLVFSLAASVKGYAAQYQAQVIARNSSIALAEANVALAAGQTQLAQSNLALVQSDLRAQAATLAVTNATIARARAEIAALSSTVQSTATTYLLRNATLQLAEAETARSASLATLAALGRQQAALSAQVTAAQVAQTESTLALSSATAASSVAMGRAAVAARAAFAFIGGWVGLAAIALVGLYEVLQKVTGAEEKAATKAKALSDALARSNEEVKKLSAAEVDVDFAKTEQSIDDVQKKIKTLESFKFGKLFDLSAIATQRDNLLQTLDVLKQRKDALIAQKNEQIMNFDASTLSTEQLNTELADTKAKIDEISSRVDPLKQQVDDGFISSDAVNADLSLLNAYKAKLADLQAVTGEGVTTNKKMEASLAATEAAYKEFFTTVEALYQQEVERVNQREQQQTLELERSVTDEQERARLISDINLKSNQERIRLAKAFADEQTRIVEAMYAKEIQKAQSNGLSIAGLEKALFIKKIDILKALETATKAAIDKMISEEQRHLQAAQAAAEQRKNAIISSEQEIQGFLRETMDEWQKANSFRNEQETQWAALRKAQAAGDFEEQQRIARRLMDIALEKGRTEREIAEQTGESVDGVNRRAVASYQTAFDAMQGSLKGLESAEQGAADKARAAAEEAGRSLQNVQDRIGELQRRLGQNTSSTHTISDNVDEVMARIKSLDGQNTTSTHTVKQVTEQARQHGGPILQLNAGGQLSGWGGGDIVDAKLEPGEFVMRKEAVAKYGSGLFAKLNAMNVSVGDVVKRRFGGIIPGFATGGSVGEAPRVDYILGLGESIAHFNRRMLDDQLARQQAIARAELDKIRQALTTSITEAITPFAGQQRDERLAYKKALDQAVAENQSAAQKIDETFAKDSQAADPEKQADAKAARDLALKQLEEQHQAAMAQINTEHQERGKSITLERQTRISAIYEEFKLRADEVNKSFNPLKRNSGGGIPGSGNTDTVPAMLTPGEWVINKTSVAHYGHAFMDAVNRGVLPKGFNTGGPVTPSSGSNVTVQFKAPNGQTAQAQFGSQADVNQFLEVIKLSGGVTA